MDAPERTVVDADRCDGHWLVLGWSWATGPACGDAQGSGCSAHPLGAR